MITESQILITLRQATERLGDLITRLGTTRAQLDQLVGSIPCSPAPRELVQAVEDLAGYLADASDLFKFMEASLPQVDAHQVADVVEKVEALTAGLEEATEQLEQAAAGEQAAAAETPANAKAAPSKASSSKRR